LKIKIAISNFQISKSFQPNGAKYFKPLAESNEFEPRLKYAKNWFQLSAGLNLEQ